MVEASVIIFCQRPLPSAWCTSVDIRTTICYPLFNLTRVSIDCLFCFCPQFFFLKWLNWMRCNNGTHPNQREKTERNYTKLITPNIFFWHWTASRSESVLIREVLITSHLTVSFISIEAKALFHCTNSTLLPFRQSVSSVSRFITPLFRKKNITIIRNNPTI